MWFILSFGLLEKNKEISFIKLDFWKKIRKFHLSNYDKAVSGKTKGYYEKEEKNEVQRKEAGMKFLYEIPQGGQHVPRFP